MKNQPYDKFWQRLHRSARKKKTLLRVMFELTYRCNFRCRHCYIPCHYKNSEELNTREVFLILEQLRDAGCLYLGFTGGEPFARNDILPIIRHAKKLGFEVIIYTNGSLIDKKQIAELARLKINKIDITIPAVSKASFERITGVIGSRDRVFKAIRLLSENRVNLGFKTCVLKENESEIEKIQDFSRLLGCRHRLDDILFPRLDGSREPCRYRGILGSEGFVSTQDKSFNTECEPPNQILLESQGKVADSAKITELFKCGSGVTQAAITPSGELKVCLMIDYPKYKILRSSLKLAWSRLKELIEGIRPDDNYQCSRCGLTSYCRWCPARGWSYNRKFTSCEPESRRKAGLIRDYEIRSQA